MGVAGLLEWNQLAGFIHFGMLEQPPSARHMTTATLATSTRCGVLTNSVFMV